jgi:beta-lactamase regulating signal transducer with metallopeptidase domain
MNAILTAIANGALLSIPLVAAVWLVLRLGVARMVNAATRYAIWWAALAVVVALPLLFLPSRPAAPRVAPVHHSVTATQLPVSTPQTAAVWHGPITPLPPPKPAVELQVEHRWGLWVLTVWAIAAFFLLARLAVSWILLARNSSRAEDVPASLQHRCGRWLAIVASTRRRVRFASSADIAVPVAIGPRRPTILIPDSLLEALDSEELDQIGLHEAAHLARWDDYALLAQRVIEALFGLHPVVRWIARQIDLEREIACDDRVVASMGQPYSYATCLTRVVELTQAGRSLAAAAAADDRSHLSRRIEMLLDKTRLKGTRLLKKQLVAGLAALALAAWAAGRSPQLVAFAAPLVRALQLPIRHVMAPVLPMPHPQQTGASGFHGRVVEDSSGTPVVSAELRFHKAGWAQLAADLETGRDGQAHAIGLDAGEYTVDVVKPNYLTVSLKVHLPTDNLLVRLVRYGVFRGEVMNEKGQPAPGRILDDGRTTGSTRICLLKKSPGGPLQYVTDTLPEPDGRYRIHDVVPGEYAVGVYYNSLPDGSGVMLYPDTAHPRLFTVAGGEDYRDINFTIMSSPAWSVSGKVASKGSDHYALALALPEQPALPIAQTLTEKGGAFRFEKVPAGVYDLFVGGPTGGYTAYDSILGAKPLYARMRVQVGGQNVEGLDITPTPGRTLQVTLRGQGNANTPPGCSQTATVAAMPLEPLGIMLQNNFTKVNVGKDATALTLPPLRYRLQATDLGTNCYQVEQPVADLTNGNADATVELATAGSLRGSLKPAPTDAYVVVMLEAGESAEGARLASPDAQGRFQFEGLRPGRYRIAAKPASDAKARWVADVTRMFEIEVRGGAPTDLDLPLSGGAR